MCSRHETSQTTPDAEEWGKKMKVKFHTMKRIDLLSDPIQLPKNGRYIGAKWVYK